MLNQLCRQFPDKKILLLIERLDETAANAQQRIARRRFYLKMVLFLPSFSQPGQAAIWRSCAMERLSPGKTICVYKNTPWEISFSIIKNQTCIVRRYRKNHENNLFENQASSPSNTGTAVIRFIICRWANASALLLAQMINNGVAANSKQMIWIFAAIMAAVTVFSCIVSFFSVKIASYISTDFAAKLRNLVFSTVQNFSAAEMDTFGTASLVTRSTSDITNVQNFLTLCFASDCWPL